MAIITTPGAGVSPYETTTTTPTVLRASADGTTTLAAAATDAIGANTSVYVSGQAALNSLITSGQPGVFDGANVTINLEEQNFNTTNQVTSTINSPSGNTGEIQYNSGANSFASDPYFTYTNSNVITPGIRTNNYLYANGAPFLAGGNAAIGNFVFTGDNMTISHANSTLNINGNGTGNIDVTANGNTWTFGNNRILTLPGGPRIVPVGANLELQAASGGYAEIVTSDGNNYVAVTGSGAQIVTSGINTWTFDNVGNLILPGNTFAVKYANGDTVAISSGGFPLANGTSNIDIATANGNVTVTANGSPTWTFAADGNLTFPSNAEITVDVTGAAVFQHEGGVTIAETNGNSLVYNTVIELFDNAIHLGTAQQGNAYSWDLSQDGSMTVPGNITGANVVSANVYTAISNVSITSSGNTWTFNTDGNLTLPAAGNIVGAVNIIGNGTGNVNVEANGRAWTFAADGNLVLPLAGNIVNYGNTWTFGYNGVLTLPGNIIAINYANGNRVTGNVTFRDEIVIGTGTSNLISGLYLAPSSSSADASMYLRVRGNIVDEPTHIHFDTGNNAYYNQFIGDDNKYIQLANTGNIVINTNDLVGNAAQWNFDTDGNLTFPTGNLVIISDYAAEANAAAISSTDHVLALLSTGVNGGVQSVWVEDVANIGTSNTAAVRVSPISQIGNVQIQTGNNSSINTWTFGTTGVLTLPNADASGFGNIYFEENSSTITFGLDDNATPFLYSFATSGITLPTGGARIRDTAGNSIAFGLDAGQSGQGNSAVAIGELAGNTSQGANSVAIGANAAANVQGNNSVAVGWYAGYDTQGEGAVAIGFDAGGNAQGILSVAIGTLAGNNSQGNAAVAVGYNTGITAQGNGAVAIGTGAGRTSQGDHAVAIGDAAGFDTQGVNSVVIGSQAGESATGNNSIIINATGNTLNQTTANTFTVAPVRNDVANIAEIVFYNATSKEITYGNVISVAGNITGGNITTGGLISATANITGGNITTAGVLKISGASSYIDVAGTGFIQNAGTGELQISSVASKPVIINANAGAYGWSFGTAGNLTLPNGGTLIGTGNITGGNLLTGGLISATANITGGNVLTGGAVKTGSFVTGTIPTAAGVGAGARAFVTDADSITFGNLYVGGAANAMPVWSNGTSWYIG